MGLALPPASLPLTDGGAKTKQGPGLSPVYQGNHPRTSKEQRGPRLIQQGLARRARKAVRRPETMLSVDDESRAGRVGNGSKCAS